MPAPIFPEPRPWPFTLPQLTTMLTVTGLERALSKEAATVLNLEGTIDDMMNMMHAHPTVWEALGDAFASVRGLQINV